MHRTTSVTHSRPRRRDSPCRHEVRSGRPTGTPPPPLWSIPPFPGRLTSDPDDPSDFGPRPAGGSGGDDCRVEVGVGRCAHGDCLFDPRCAPRAPSKPWPEAPRPRDAPAYSGASLSTYSRDQEIRLPMWAHGGIGPTPGAPTGQAAVHPRRRLARRSAGPNQRSRRDSAWPIRRRTGRFRLGPIVAQSSCLVFTVARQPSASTASTCP